MNDYHQLKYLCKEIKVDLNDLILSQEAIFDDDDLVYLDLTRVNLKTEIRGIFDAFINLIELKLILSIKIEIPENVFENLRNLVVLHMTCKQVIPEKIFDSLSSLRVLHLTTSRTIDPKIFENLNLRTLSISGQKTIRLELFSSQNNLQELFIYDNKLNTLPDKIFDNLIELKILEISNNHIQRLPKGIFDRLSNLIELNLSNNLISDLPDKILENLLVLESLNLSNNRMNSIKYHNLHIVFS